MKLTAILPLLLALTLAGGAPAHAASTDAAATQAQPGGTEAIGVVDAFDAAKGIATISHEAIKSLDWPAMTMEFVCKDKKLAKKLVKGKKINFRFVEQHGNYIITDVK